MKSLTKHWHKDVLILLILGFLAFLSYAYPIRLIGISVNFASLFLLIAGRLTDTKKVVILTLAVHTLAMLILDESFLTLTLITLEVAVVTGIYRRLRNGIVAIPFDFVYWILLGMPVMLLVYGLHFGKLDFGIVLFIIALLINQLFNALMADLIVSYSPVLRNWRMSRRDHALSFHTVELSRILIHITIFSMIGSAFLYLLNTGRIADNRLLEQTTVQGDILSSELHASFISLTSEQLRNPTEFLRTLITSTSVTVDEAELYDDQYRFIMGYSSSFLSAGNEWMNAEEWTSYSTTLHIWRPKKDWHQLPGSSWDSTAIIQQVDLPRYKLYLKLPNQLYIQDMIRVYMNHAVDVMFMVVIIGAFAAYIYLFVVRSIAQLARLTQDVPGKLAAGHPVEWPRSGITEIHALSDNFNTVTVELHRMLQESKTQANYDSLTGLPNRRHYNDYVQQFMNSEADRPPLAAIFIDLDRFKPVNDNFGHEVGDMLLQQVAATIAKLLPSHAFVARLGGDEFVVMLSVNRADEGRQAAGQILEALRIPFRVNDHELRISGSIGVSLYPDHSASLDTVVKFADEAMYRAKDAGGSRICMYEV